MKRLTLPLLLLIILSVIPAPITAQTTHQPATSGQSTLHAGATSFTIVFLGTRHYSDVNPIITSLKGLPHITELTPSLESQSRLEFVGFFTGPQRSLTADVASLAANRFTMNKSSGDEQALTITLKKISTPSTINSF